MPADLRMDRPGHGRPRPAAVPADAKGRSRDDRSQLTRTEAEAAGAIKGTPPRDVTRNAEKRRSVTPQVKPGARPTAQVAEAQRSSPRRTLLLFNRRSLPAPGTATCDARQPSVVQVWSEMSGA